MRPDTVASITRARRDLEEARMLAATVRLPHLTARSAYYAAFHAAEAFILERTGRVAKTHRGVHTTFSQLVKDGSSEDRILSRILPDGYRYKELADYSINPDAVVSDQAAAAMIEDAARFVDRVADLLASTPP